MDPSREGGGYLTRAAEGWVLPALRPTEHPTDARLSLALEGQAESPAHAFTFNCLDVRVIVQLKQKGNLFAQTQ